MVSFFKECLSRRLFVWFFAYSAATGVAGAINAFATFMEFSIGLTMQEIGMITGTALFLGVLLMYPIWEHLWIDIIP